MRWLVLLVSGCVTSGRIGALGTSTTTARSVELEGSIGGGLGDETSAMVVSEQGSIGVAASGGLEGHIITTTEYVHFGDRFGWQAGLSSGVSLGAFQDQNLTFEAFAGPRWNLSRDEGENQKIKLWSVELDAGAGYGFFIGDGTGTNAAVFSLDVVARYDLIDLRLP